MFTLLTYFTSAETFKLVTKHSGSVNASSISWRL